MERVTGIEPVSRPWQGRIIPLYDTRLRCFATSARQARLSFEAPIHAMCRAPESNWVRLPLQGSALPMS